MEAGRAQRSSVDNALHIALLLHSAGEVRVNQTADTLGISPSTAHRLLRSLQTHGFAVQDPASKAYRSGPMLSAAGTASHRTLLRTCAASLQAIADESSETSHLAVLEGRFVRYIDAVEGRHVVRVASRVGTMLPAHCSSVGKAMLAALSDAELRTLYPSTLRYETRTPHSIDSWTALSTEIATVRQVGYARNDAESEPGVAAVAAAIVVDDRAVAAISCAMPNDRMSDAVLQSTIDLVSSRVALVARSMTKERL